MDFRKGLILQIHMLQTQICTALKAWQFFYEAMIRSSRDPSVGRLNAQCINDSLIIFEGRATQASRICFVIFLRSGAFKLPTSVSLLIPFLANQLLYFSVQLTLEV